MDERGLIPASGGNEIQPEEIIFSTRSRKDVKGLPGFTELYFHVRSSRQALSYLRSVLTWYNISEWQPR